MSLAYIGIGSNLGNKRENCLRAIEIISQAGIVVTRQSSLYETEPWGMEDQPKFMNMAVEAKTDLRPMELLRLLKDTERGMGRQETTKWGPRIIDLDIILYDDIVMNTHELTIPHPLMHEREFVLMPLSEIAPDAVHPVMGRKISELLAALRSQEK